MIWIKIRFAKMATGLLSRGNAFYTTPAESVRVNLHERFHRMLFCAWDLEQITPVSERELAKTDRYYRTREGLPVNYYRPDEEGNQLVVYPRPSTVVWDELDYTEVMADTGGIIRSEAWIIEDEVGVVIDVIDAAGQLMMAYEYMPVDLVDVAETPEMPEWMVHVVKCGVLERAFGADTDGFIPTLRDYWQMRKTVGIEAIRKVHRMRLGDRDFRLGMAPKAIVRRHPTLGDHYPSTWP